jgi:hypothetical protein
LNSQLKTKLKKQSQIIIEKTLVIDNFEVVIKESKELLENVLNQMDDVSF